MHVLELLLEGSTEATASPRTPQPSQQAPCAIVSYHDVGYQTSPSSSGFTCRFSASAAHVKAIFKRPKPFCWVEAVGYQPVLEGQIEFSFSTQQAKCHLKYDGDWLNRNRCLIIPGPSSCSGRLFYSRLIWLPTSWAVPTAGGQACSLEDVHQFAVTNFIFSQFQWDKEQMKQVNHYQDMILTPDSWLPFICLIGEVMVVYDLIWAQGKGWGVQDFACWCRALTGTPGFSNEKVLRGSLCSQKWGGKWLYWGQYGGKLACLFIGLQCCWAIWYICGSVWESPWEVWVKTWSS